ncbi:uncharacterized protein LOC119429083 [Nematolebias whitei]|uniref:uncharacterized protein LOC119429083 n=1 Tax=Nematolebias whitei TaxID=451745 RepID=UPI001898505C|nr:uncharacterized protein LOC119429083 [Nematolebias whitei]
MFPSVSFLAIVLCHLAISTSALKELPSINVRVGGTVVLQPGPVDGSISSVTWKHNIDLAVEWFNSEKPEYYREFKDHASLNQADGVLTISRLTTAFSGTYTVEISNKVISSQKLQVLHPVLKPTISVKKKTATSYVLMCNPHVNDQAQLVQVKWIVDEQERSETSNTLTINEETASRSFFCILTNPVSNMSSDAVTNPFLTDSDNSGLIIGTVVVVIILLAVLVFLLILIVRPPSSLKDKPAVKRLRDSGFGKAILSACSCLTGKQEMCKHKQNNKITPQLHYHM